MLQCSLILVFLFIFRFICITYPFRYIDVKISFEKSSESSKIVSENECIMCLFKVLKLKDYGRIQKLILVL